MDPRRLLAACVLLAALTGAFYWSQRSKEAEAAKPANAAKVTHVLAVPAAQIKELRLQPREGEATVVERSGTAEWKITAPTALPADPNAVNELVNTVATLDADRVVDEKPTDLQAFGLEKPALTITANGNKLHVGDTTPTGTGVFVRKEGDPRVFTVSTATKTALEKTAADLRDKRVLTFDSDKLSRIELTTAQQTVEFGKSKDGDWQIIKPQPQRADGATVEQLVQRLRDAKLDPNSGDTRAAFQKAALVAVARTTDLKGTQELTVRKGADDTYYAQSSVAPSAFKLNKELGDTLARPVDEYQNKKLFDFGFNEPNLIELTAAGKTYRFTRNGEQWSAEGKAMDTVSVQNLIDKLRDLTAVKFVSTGFTAPTTTITIHSSDGKRNEKVAIAQALARREGDTTLYQLDPKSLDEVLRAAADVKAPPPAAKK